MDVQTRFSGGEWRPNLILSFILVHRIYRLKLECALTGYLVEESHRSGSVKAVFAGTMLGEMGYFHQPRKPDENALQSIVDMLVPGEDENTLSEISSICLACPLVADCDVGQVILTKASSDS